MADCERIPLLSDQNIPPENSEPPPPYSAFLDAGSDNLSDAATLPVGTNELPPPYTPTTRAGFPMVNCKVCQAIINLEGKEHLYVVKCSVCNEATPLRAAPPGKKYIRCTCNLLLVCRSGATKVLCPRETCKRVITLPRHGTDLHHWPMMSRYLCAYCNQIFELRVDTKFARCPHCRKLSSIGHNYARNRSQAYCVAGGLFLGASIGTTIVTYDSVTEHEGIFVAWIGGFFLGLMLLVRGIYYLTIKTSHLLQPSLHT